MHYLLTFGSRSETLQTDLCMYCYKYLYKQIMHSFCLHAYNQSLKTASESRLIGSVVRALDFCPGGPGLESHQKRVIFK